MGLRYAPPIRLPLFVFFRLIYANNQRVGMALTYITNFSENVLPFYENRLASLPWLSYPPTPYTLSAGYQIAGMSNRTTMVDNNTWKYVSLQPTCLLSLFTVSFNARITHTASHASLSLALVSQRNTCLLPSFTLTTTSLSRLLFLSFSLSRSSNTHIAQVGKAMSSNESRAYEIMRELDVDYILVLFGGLIGYSGDGKYR